MYTSGVFVVKEGHETEFARRWQESADATSMSTPGLKFMLLRDAEDPRRFVSLGEGWRNVEQIEEARSRPEYQDTLASMWRLLDSGEISTLELAVEVS